MDASSGLAHHRPSHIRAKVLATHHALGGALNSRAILGWHTAPGAPHVGRMRRNTNGAGQSGHTASSQRGLFDDVGVCFTHEGECATLTNGMQASGTMPVVSSISERLKLARLRLNLSQVELAKRAGVAAGTIGNLEAGTREKPRNLLGIARALGVTPEWLEEGKELAPDTVASGVSPVAHPVILDAITVVPQIDWEQLMGVDPLPTVFKLSAPDTSMAPKVPQGTIVEFTRGLEPRPGDGVLVRDSLGHHFFRQFREKRPGHWEAHAVNEAYRPMDSKDDNLSVVAVLTAVAGRWA